MGDCGGFVGFENAFIIARAERFVAGVGAVDGLRGAEDGVRIGERLRQVVYEGELRVADADDVAGLELVVVVDSLAIDECAVAAVEVAESPLALGLEDFGVVAAATFIFDDDGVGWRAADGDGFAIDEAEYVCPFRAFANNQVGRHRMVWRFRSFSWFV